MRGWQGKTLKELEAFANATWDNCLLPFRECLIRVYRQVTQEAISCWKRTDVECREWSDFDADGPCPYEFSEEEIQKHREDGIAFNESQEFWESLSHIVSDEGYTSNEGFDSVMELFRGLREEHLSVLQGAEREQFDQQTRWAVPAR